MAHRRADALEISSDCLADLGRDGGFTLGAAGLEKAGAGQGACDQTQSVACGRKPRRPRSLGDGSGRGHAGLTFANELGITIIWVEHIMGVLMRVVDRVMVLDHGEKIAEGEPHEVASRSSGSLRCIWVPTRKRPLPRRPAGLELAR